MTGAVIRRCPILRESHTRRCSTRSRRIHAPNGRFRLTTWPVACALASFVGGCDPITSPQPPAAQPAALVNTVDASAWLPPSPDPAGIVHVEHLGHLAVSDSEVNEIPSLFTGANLFETMLDGTLLRTFDTLDLTEEPTGLAYDPSNLHLFVATDNSAKRVFEIDPGADALYGTADDSVTSFSTLDFGSNDAEGLTFNPQDGTLLVVDGVNSEVYTVDPGFDGRFNGMPPAGDDTVSSFDTTTIGITDPEGIAYDSDFGHLYIVGKPATRVAHVSLAGTLLRTIDISAAGASKPAGLAYAPSSVDPSARSNLFIVDRGVDNDTDPNENDGRIFEFSLPDFEEEASLSMVTDGPMDEVASVGRGTGDMDVM